MSTFDLDLSELNKLVVDFERAGERAIRLAELAVAKTTTDIESTAKIFAPVDTGNLQGSIGHDMDSDGLGSEIGPTADYGIYVETGTSRMAPAAYMGPAFDRHAWELERALALCVEL